jgi:hypothetical protein
LTIWKLHSLNTLPGLLSKLSSCCSHLLLREAKDALTQCDLKSELHVVAQLLGLIVQVVVLLYSFGWKAGEVPWSWVLHFICA